MKAQTELTRGKKLGILLEHLCIPDTLEEAAFNMFVRGTNLDETFVQSRKPKVHTSVLDRCERLVGRGRQGDTPLIELGFYGGRRDPELFVQDQPTQGSAVHERSDQIQDPAHL
jgi:hypothetical protein